ncbi:diguanylate cyclase [Bradyrhizobium sp. CCBAU 65884]|nr:diguanylate cyclase [Bradyrhizobium sp. CCBAU 65884]
MTMHRLLARQIRQSTDESGQVDLTKLCELVGAAYEEGDRDRRRTDRAMKLMIEELEQTHKRAEQDLLRAREFLDSIIENIPIAVFAKDAKDSRYVLLNRAGEEYYGMPREAMLGKTPQQIFPDHIARVVNEQDRRVVDSGAPMFLEGHLLEVGVKGRDRLVNSRKLLVRDGSGAPQYLVGVIEDVTERITNEARISHLAHHDALTDLPNRSAFNAVLGERLERAQEAATSFAVLSLDLDRFKEVNDVFGHPVGDLLMRAAADRLAEEADGAFVARIGGDEFMILMPDDISRDDVLALAERLVETIGQELEVDDYLSHVGLSVGIAFYPDDGVNAATLLANADSALYRAKREGRGRVRFFESEMDQELRDRRLLQHDLRLALEQNQFLVYFQPQARVDGEVIGFEALLRWNHPTRGFVPPDQFIPLAEENGLIVQIGEWVLREACREAASWPRPLQVAVNLSPIQFQAGDLERSIHQILLETGLTPTRLEVEITEGVLIGDFTRALNLLRRLKALGIRIAMDDFGTGYSSLSYLQSFPFDKIKIDRSFISNLEATPQSAEIVRAVLSLAHALRIPVIAEGVETEAQRAFLAREACEEMQGYLVGRPALIERYLDLVGVTVERRLYA